MTTSEPTVPVDTGTDPSSTSRGTTPLNTVVSSNGARVVNSVVATVLAVSPAVVTVVSIVAIAVLGIDRVLHTSDVVTVLLAAIGAHQAVVAAQSLRKSG